MFLDHIMWGASDLDAGIDEFERLSGVRAAYGGPHPGNGTRNALCSLGPGVYFEIIAPDPEQPLTGTFGEALARRAEPAVLALAMRSTDLAGVDDVFKDAGIATERLSMSRDAPDGTVLNWDLLIPGARRDRKDPFTPFFIDWGNTRHPSEVTPSGCGFVGLEAAHPDAKRIGALWQRLGVPGSVRPADEPSLTVTLSSPKGEIVLNGG